MVDPSSSVSTAVPTVTNLFVALVTAVPALGVAALGWYLSRRDLRDEIAHLREENRRLTEALNLAMYGRGGSGCRHEP